VLSEKCDTTRTGNTPQSQSAGAVRGDGHGPLLQRTCAFYFIIREKEFSRAGFSTISKKSILQGLFSLFLKKRETFRCHYRWMNGPVEKLLC
jgi:hypothetical protein